MECNEGVKRIKNGFIDRTYVLFLKGYWKGLLSCLLPILLVPLPVFGQTKECAGAYILVLMSVFWVTDAVPIAVTSLLPVVLAPVLGLMSPTSVALNYCKDVSMLFLGGIMVALCVEKWNLHRRIALRVLLWSGTTTRWLMLGVMLPTWFLSMWISNTAATAMMVPIVSAIINNVSDEEFSTNGHMEIEMTDIDMNEACIETDQTQEEMTSCHSHKQRRKQNMSKGMMLCLAYAATCGGVATLTGTGPNLVMKETVDRLYGGAGITFGTWMLFCLPVSLASVVGGWLCLHTYFFGFRSTFLGCTRQKNDKVQSALREHYQALGSMRFSEYAVSVLFTSMVALWLTKESEFFPGWGKLLPKGHASDSLPAILVALLMFVIPSTIPLYKGNVEFVPLMDWKTVSTSFPWHIILLLGGGFALADVCKNSGLTTVVVGHLSAMQGSPDAAIAFVVCLLAAVVTEVTSNTAVATVILPVIADLARDISVNPIYLMLPATLGCSFAFMLPSATPPNAVVFSQGVLTMWDMMKAGLLMNVICLLVLTLAINTWGVAIFHLDTFPDWANRTVNVSVL